MSQPDWLGPAMDKLKEEGMNDAACALEDHFTHPNDMAKKLGLLRDEWVKDFFEEQDPQYECWICLFDSPGRIREVACSVPPGFQMPTGDDEVRFEAIKPYPRGGVPIEFDGHTIDRYERMARYPWP